MAARWKHPNYKNYHEQMKIRCALVAHSYNYGAATAAIKFECSIPCVYQWRDKLYGTEYWNYVQMIQRHEDYDTYVIFNQ